ncbi:hypothetical protein JAAARDRAFT_197346 [Jaapia argillacea MUCL 33604]|uniref:Uncharacterized protein n=1 Tax=Jaapia argillacea MUCL 33604 TaxID=933084 RepID=A0A067PF58_9AGAM|nr:hypothetical protein JAAARDRAFT_197346 [Jaapia argillacea MUCL 33604]
MSQPSLDPLTRLPLPAPTPTKPSSVLTSLSQSLPADAFNTLLVTHLYPLLDALPPDQRESIFHTLEDVKKESDRTQSILDHIDFEGHQASLEGGMKALLKHVKMDWDEGYEEQGEMMERIAGEVIAWLPALWCAAVENGMEIPQVHRCAVLCTDIIHQLSETNSRTIFTEIAFDVKIQDSTGKIIYHDPSASLDHALCWFWRELALAAIAHKSTEKTIRAIMSDIDHFEFVDDVETMLRTPGEDKNHDGYDFCDDHWIEDMRAAVPSLADLLTAARLASFEASPSVEMYEILVTQRPSLNPALLAATRARIFPEHGNPTISYGAASAIFQKASQTDDLIRLIDALPKFYRGPDVQATRKGMISYFAAQESPELRVKALAIIEDSLKTSKSDVWLEAQEAVPYLQEANDWLREHITSGTFPLDDGEHLTRQQANKRDELVLKFVDIARRGQFPARDADAYAFGDDYYEDDYVREVESEDSDYNELLDIRKPDLENGIRDWVGVLLDWPDREEAAAVWDVVRTKERDGAEDVLIPFWDVEGIAEALAGRFDWEYNHDSSQQHVADGFRALYRTFLKPDLEALDADRPKRISMPGPFSARQVLP